MQPTLGEIVRCAFIFSKRRECRADLALRAEKVVGPKLADSPRTMTGVAREDEHARQPALRIDGVGV